LVDAACAVGYRKLRILSCRAFLLSFSQLVPCVVEPDSGLKGAAAATEEDSVMATDPHVDTAEYGPWDTASHRPATADVRVDLGALSHQGLVRPNNEDCFLVGRLERTLVPVLTNLPEGELAVHAARAVGYGLVVADGMGGKAAGEVASRLAVTALVDLQARTPDWIMLTGESEEERAMGRLAARYGEVDAALKQAAQENPAQAGMGTTLTIAYSLGDHLFLGHVGDSRAYLLRGEQLHQLTRDHTRAQQLVDQGMLGPEEAARSRFRNVLTRALGDVRGTADAEVQRARLRDGDQLLLCSDGLTDMVDDAAIAAALRQAATAAAACQALIDLALQRGGRDNVTVALARYRFPPAP
jgi:protein phosphatase